MLEAFRKAAKQNPNSEATGIFKGVEHSQYVTRQARKHERGLEKLGGEFENIGGRWLGYLQEKSLSAKQIREDWRNLLPRLANIQEGERTGLITRLAKGLMLSEDNTNSDRYTMPGPLFKYSGHFQEIPNGVRLSPQSTYFIGAVSELHGDYGKEGTSLIDFVGSRGDSRGLVRLPKVLPVVAEWLVQQSNAA